MIDKRTIIRGAFLVPIISVALVSVSHVVRWYGLANPFSWAVYLSIAVEVAALSAIAAASIRVKGFSVWLVFSIVTLIQFIGNIYYSYSEINESTPLFKSWVELTTPVFDSLGADVSNPLDQKRWLAILEGGLLPLISLTCLHFFIKYGEEQPVQDQQQEVIEEVVDREEDHQVETEVAPSDTEDLPYGAEEERQEDLSETEQVILNEPKDFPYEKPTPPEKTSQPGDPPINKRSSSGKMSSKMRKITRPRK